MLQYENSQILREKENVEYRWNKRLRKLANQKTENELLDVVGRCKHFHPPRKFPFHLTKAEGCTS